MAWFSLTSANVYRDPSSNFVAETWLSSTLGATYFETAMSPPWFQMPHLVSISAADALLLLDIELF